MRQYGEILFLGPCNLRCYYCLSTEMPKLQSEQENQMNTHFFNWVNFNQFLTKCKEKQICTIYLSSVTTEPLLYQYLKELILFLQGEGFRVGIRSNGMLATSKMQEILLLDEEISFSMNSLNSDTTKLITGVPVYPDWIEIFGSLRKANKKCRISIVVNQHNQKEIPEMLNFLAWHSDVVNYVQLRQVYKYGNRDDAETNAFVEIKYLIQTHCTKNGSYFESKIYKYRELSISLWEDVFQKESIQSVNFFTNGLISTNNLLIPAYEKGETS